MDCVYDFTLAPVGERLTLSIVQTEKGRRVLARNSGAGDWR